MIKKTYIMIAFIAIAAILVVSVVSAMSFDDLMKNRKQMHPANSCQVSNQIRPGNQINFQIPHFVCCKCDENETMPCNCDPVCTGNNCMHGDILRKHLNFMNMSECGAMGEGDINVYNYNGLDRTKIVLRLSHLPRNSAFTAWLMYNNGDSLSLGMLKSNMAGRASLSFSQIVSDFNSFDSIVITDQNMSEVLSANVNFHCMSMDKNTTDPGFSEDNPILSGTQ